MVWYGSSKESSLAETISNLKKLLKMTVGHTDKL